MKKYLIEIEVDFDFEGQTDISAELLGMEDIHGENGDCRNIYFEDMSATIEVEVEAEDEEDAKDEVDSSMIKGALEDLIQLNWLISININSWEFNGEPQEV